MSLRALGALLALALFLVLPGAAEARRVALVIGNAAYRQATPLRNPVNDASALSARLGAMGFEVLTGTDLDLAGMRDLVRDFGHAASGAELALFFYAGHGIQVDGQNFLLPVNAAVQTEADLDFTALDVDLILRQMDRGATTRIVLLDACRNNPFEGPLSRSMGLSRSAEALGRGLARISASGGSLIAFATEPGAVASDGEGQHSPFTQALLEHMMTPGLEINVMLTRVRADVFSGTGSTQRPWTSSSLIGEVYLMPGEAAPALAPTGVPSSEAMEIAVWKAAEAGGSANDFEAFIKLFPESPFADLARHRITTLQVAPAAKAEVAGEPSAVPNPGGEAPRLASVAPAAAAPPAEAGDPPADAPVAEAALVLGIAKRREIQERLSLLGFNTRGIDGIFGSGSRSAIARWQEQAGLSATGYLDSTQIARLEAATDSALAAFQQKLESEKENAWRKFEGQWSGTIRQPGSASYSLVLTVDGNGRISARYPELKCGGSWTLIGRDGPTLRFIERVTENRKQCIDNTIVLRVLGENRLRIRSYVDGDTVVAEGELRRR